MLSQGNLKLWGQLQTVLRARVVLRGCLVTGRKTPSHGSDEGPQGGSHETGVDVFYAGKARELSERGQGPGGSRVTSSGSWDAWGPRLGGGGHHPVVSEGPGVVQASPGGRGAGAIWGPRWHPVVLCGRSVGRMVGGPAALPARVWTTETSPAPSGHTSSLLEGP